MPNASKQFLKLLIAGLIGVGVLGIFLFFRAGEDKKLLNETQTFNNSSSGVNVSFLAADGYKLSGTYWTSDSKERRPAIILSHQFNSTRHDYDSFVPLLLKNGYAVLAYDTRGFGESKNGTANINNFPKDVLGAVDFLKKQAEVDSSRIGIIGASVGANVAFVVSGSIKEIRAAVALSPSNTGARGVLLGNDLPNFYPSRIFIASDEREKDDADFIYAKAADPKEQHIYPGFGHGIGLLRSEEAQNDILLFLERMFTADVSTPLYQDIHIPVVLHVVKNSGQISSARREDKVSALFQKAQTIWNQARIVFDVKIEETALGSNIQKAIERQNFADLYAVLPKNDRVFHIFFVRTLNGPNGISIAPSLALIADSTTVNDFRATAHEIGHLLGLSHTDDSQERLLFRGANGTELAPEEVLLARQGAELFKQSN